MGEAINQAGRQRMLTQRMVKAYAMVGLGVDPDRAAKQLQAAAALFEQQLINLKAFAPSAQISTDLGEVDVRWQPFKTLVTGRVDQAKALEVRALGNQALAAAHQVVLSLQAASATSAGHLVNIAGRQRMLSQRLAGLYMFKAWGIQSDTLDSDYATAIEEFSAALKELRAAPANTESISAELKQVNSHWSLYQRSARLRDGQYIPLLIVRSSDKILFMMNNVTGQYAKIADQVAP